MATFEDPGRNPAQEVGGGIKWEGGGSLYKPNATLEGPRFDPLLLSFLFKTCGLWTLSCDFAHTIHETLKCLIRLPALTLSHSGGVSEASKWKDIGTYHPFLPPPTHPSPPSLISRKRLLWTLCPMCTYVITGLFGRG